MQDSALDLGAPGPDNQYGAGLIDVPAAHLDLSGGGGIPVPFLSGPGLIGVLIALWIGARRATRSALHI